MSTVVVTETRTAVAEPEAPPLVLLDDPDAVDAWLKSLDPGAVVGESRREAACPLATYLRYANPEQDAYVYPWCCVVLSSDVPADQREGLPVEDERVHANPGWVARFVAAIDYRFWGANKFITAAMARRVLAQARRENGYYVAPEIDS